MANHGFKIGDRVVLLVDHPDGNRNLTRGDEGEILRINNTYDLNICVDWNKKIGYGDMSTWWVRSSWIDFVDYEICLEGIDALL